MKLIICEMMSWCFAKQIIRDLILSVIVIEQFNPSIRVKNLLGEIWKFVNLVSYASQQRGSPSLDAFGIFHDHD